MAFVVNTAANAAFKRLLGKAHTDNQRGIGNETVISGFNFSGDDIYGDEIPFNNPSAAIASGISSAKTTLNLELDAGSNGHAYLAKLPVGYVNPNPSIFRNKSGNPAAAGDYIKDTNISIISGAYGVGYAPVVFNNGVMVPPSDSSDWIFDTYAGVLTQEGVDDGSMINYGENGTVECYLYTGRTIVQRVQEVISGGTKSKVVRMTFENTSYGVVGVLDPATNDYTSVVMDVFGGPTQQKLVDYSLINITNVGTTGLVSGYYLAVYEDTIELLQASGATVVGSNPSIGIKEIIESGDIVQVSYNIPE